MFFSIKKQHNIAFPFTSNVIDIHFFTRNQCYWHLFFFYKQCLWHRLFFQNTALCNEGFRWRGKNLLDWLKKISKDCMGNCFGQLCQPAKSYYKREMRTKAPFQGTDNPRNSTEKLFSQGSKLHCNNVPWIGVAFVFCIQSDINGRQDAREKTQFEYIIIRRITGTIFFNGRQDAIITLVYVLSFCFITRAFLIEGCFIFNVIDSEISLSKVVLVVYSMLIVYFLVSFPASLLLLFLFFFFFLDFLYGKLLCISVTNCHIIWNINLK